jgi:uncharacterized protein
MVPTFKFTNHLINESSSYLQQHAHNPVDWYPWGEEALKRARLENKLLFISIGYSACHWCHVMERGSFENVEIAEILNKNYISIKIDREQRPDLDHIYMSAVQIISGSGGWPLNCFALPDGRPVWGGTYFLPTHFMKIIKELVQKWTFQPGVFETAANELKAGMAGFDIISEKAPILDFGIEQIDVIYSKMEQSFDRTKGGYDQKSKFPMPSDWKFIMKYAYYTLNKSAIEQVNLTLTRMAMGGIYDQIGGGFSRYATDKEWKIPHFEKMLYDNAQLISLYCDAWKASKNKLYKKVVYETVEFVTREMLSDEFGFYSSIDADSEGKEGEYYAWSKKEVDKLLGPDANFFSRYYGISTHGNWENGKNILCVNKTITQMANDFNMTDNEVSEKIALLNRELLITRETRKHPDVDNKILTSWNALMLKAFIDAYRTFGERQWLDLALKNANFIMSQMMKEDYSLLRSYKNHKAEIDGFLDDYAFCSLAFIDLYQATLNEKWLIVAQKLADYAINHFIDDQSGLFFYNSDLSEVHLFRKMELFDNVLPSSNSAMANALYLLGSYFDDANYMKLSKQMMANMILPIEQQGAFSSNWLSIIIWDIQAPKEVVITGDKSLENITNIDQYYFPDIITAGSQTESSIPLLKNRYVPGKTMTYICVNNHCQLPLEEINDVLVQLQR